MLNYIMPFTETREVGQTKFCKFYASFQLHLREGPGAELKKVSPLQNLVGFTSVANISFSAVKKSIQAPRHNARASFA